MIDQQHCTAYMNLVPIDVAEDLNVALVQDSKLSSSNRPADHKQSIRFLQALPGCVRVALAPTGDYPRRLAYRLLQEAFEVISICSVAQARFREARNGTWPRTIPRMPRSN